MITEIAKQLKNKNYEVYIENGKIYTQNGWTGNHEFEKTVEQIVHPYNNGDESIIAINKLKDITGKRLIEINPNPVKKFNCFGASYYE